MTSLGRYAKGGLFRRMRREIPDQIEEYDFGVVRFITDLPPAGSQSTYLIAAGDLIDDEDFEASVLEAIKETCPQLVATTLTKQLETIDQPGWSLEQFVRAIQSSRFVIYRVDEDCSPTTFLALGISIGLNRPFLMICRKGREVPEDIRGIALYQFPNFVTLRRELVPRHQSFIQKYAQ